jgi:DNA ligase-1
MSSRPDIRNFFGGGKSKSTESNCLPANIFNKNKRKIIVDDEDDEFDEEPKPSKAVTVQEDNIKIISHVNSPIKSPKKEIFNNVEIPVVKEVVVKEIVKKVILTKDIDKGVVTKENIQKKDIITKKLSKSAPSSSSIPKEIENIITWKKGDRVPYSALVQAFDSASKISGRLDKEHIFTNLFRAVLLTTPDDLASIVYLAGNEVEPAYEGLELGIGDSLLVKAISEATGRTNSAVQEAYKAEGDLGDVALSSRSSQKTLSFGAQPKLLDADYVLEQMRLITKTKGEQAQGRKIKIIKAIMVRCQGFEAKYLVRALQGKLRIGTAFQTILVALAHAVQLSPTTIVMEKMASDGIIHNFFESNGESKKVKKTTLISEDDIEDDAMDVTTLDEDDIDIEEGKIEDKNKDLMQLIDEVKVREPIEARKLRLNNNLKFEDRKDLSVIAIKRAFSDCPNVTLVVTALLNYPIYLLYLQCRLIPGVPVAPMLAKPEKKLSSVLQRLKDKAFTMEYKYDGERAQVHLLSDGSVKIFSRNSEDNSLKYPDLMDVIRRARVAGIESCVIDAEVVAYDRDKDCLLPFQVLSTRKRKVEVGEEDNQKVKVALQCFDMLYINGKSLLQESLRNRRALLHSAFKAEKGFFYFAVSLDHIENGDTAPIELFLQEACSAMCEGLMIKTLESNNSSYEPSKRSLNWLKLKKDYIEGMGICDSVDLVVLGAYRGRGII